MGVGSVLLAGLAENPATPVELLVRLVSHQVARNQMAGRSGGLPDEVAAAMLGYGRDEVVVAYRKGSDAMRRRIEEHPDPRIREAFAADVRDRVTGSGLSGCTIGDLEVVYGRPRAALAVDDHPRVRAAVAYLWTDRPDDVHERLLDDPERVVRHAAIHGGRAVPVRLQERYTDDPQACHCLAGGSALTPGLAVRLVHDRRPGVSWAIADNQRLPAETVAALAEVDHPAARLAVALSRHTGDAQRDRMFALLAPGDRRRAKPRQPRWLRDEPLGRRLSFVGSPHVEFRRVVAGSSDLPAEAWARLDADPDWSVRRAAARRVDAPAAVLLALVGEIGDEGRGGRITEHPNFPRSRLREFADDPRPAFRGLALRDPDLPAEVLRRLAADPGLADRRGAVARHPNLPLDLLDEYLADPSVAYDATRNPSLPRDRMEAVLDG